MGSLRLISDTYTCHYFDPLSGKLISEKSYIAPEPKGRFLITGFVNHSKDGGLIHDLVQSAVNQDIGVVYVCDQLPCNPILNDHVVYIVADDTWFIHTLFLSPLKFSGIFYSRLTGKLAQAFSVFTQYTIPLLHAERELNKLSSQYAKVKDNVLLEIAGGVGDHLLCIPTIKTLASKGKLVYLLCDDIKKPCFENLPYVKDTFSKRNQVDVSRFPKIINLNFGQILSDYRQDFNKQNRIFSIAELCGLTKEDLVIDKPEILLTPTEVREATTRWGVYKRKVFIGSDSARVDSRLPHTLTQEFINFFKRHDCMVFSTSNRPHSFQNCIDLNRKLSLRELFGLISVMETVVTIDTSFLHIAAAFDKKTFCMFNYFQPAWRASTYKNCVTYTPATKCFPCCAGQFVHSTERGCINKSCYDYQPKQDVMRDALGYLNSITNNKAQIIQSGVSEEEITEFPGTLIQPRQGERKIAAIWLGGIGDAVMLSHLCRAIHRQHPGSLVDAFVRDESQTQVFIGDYPEIKAHVSRLPWSDTVRQMRGQYEKIYEFRPYSYVWNQDEELNAPFNAELYSNWHKMCGKILATSTKQTFLFYADSVGLNIDPEDLKLPLPKIGEGINGLLQKYSISKGFVVLSSGCDQNKAVLKLWAPSKWDELARKLRSDGIEVVQFGTSDNPEIPGVKKIQCKSIVDLLYLLQAARLCVSNEGGMVHLAHSVATPSVVLFGPTHPTLYGYPDNTNLYLNVCPSCWWKNSKWSQLCLAGFQRCKNLSQLSVSEVYSSVSERLNPINYEI